MDWELLGIDPTTDARAIKRAYSRNLKIYHPEDDPEGFGRLFDAYQLALSYAANPEEHIWPPDHPTSPGDTFVYDDGDREEGEVESSQIEEPEISEAAADHASELPDHSTPPDDGGWHPVDDRDEFDSDQPVSVEVEVDEEVDEQPGGKSLFDQPQLLALLANPETLCENVSASELQHWLKGADALPVDDRLFFEVQLVHALCQTPAGALDVIVAERVPPSLFSIIARRFEWRADELRIADQTGVSGRRLKRFFRCLNQLRTTSKRELLDGFRALLKEPDELATSSCGHDFFFLASQMDQDLRHQLALKSFKILVAHYPTVENILSPCVLNKLDRIFGWTRPVYGTRLFYLTLPCRFALTQKAKVLPNRLNQARMSSTSNFPELKHRRSLESVLGNLLIQIALTVFVGIFFIADMTSWMDSHPEAGFLLLPAILLLYLWYRRLLKRIIGIENWKLCAEGATILTTLVYVWLVMWAF